MAYSEEMINSSVIFLNMYCDCITMFVVCIVHASQELFKHSESINLFSQIPQNLHMSHQLAYPGFDLRSLQRTVKTLVE